MNRLPSLYVLLLTFATCLSLWPPHVAVQKEATTAPSDRMAIYPPVLADYIIIAGNGDRILGGSRIALDTLHRSLLAAVVPMTGKLELSRSVSPADPEMSLLVRPDSSLVWENDAAGLRRLGLAGIIGLTRHPGDPQDDHRFWTALGTIAGRSDRAESLFTQWQSSKQRLARLVPRHVRPPTIVTLYGGQGIGQIGGHYEHTAIAIRTIGARNPADGLIRTVDSNIEQLLRLDPDVILLTDTFDRTPQDLYADPAWQPLSAVRNRRIYRMPLFANIDGPVDGALFDRWLAEIVYGEAVPICLRRMIRDVYNDAFGAEPTDAALDRALQLNANRSSREAFRFTKASEASSSPAACGM